MKPSGIEWIGDIPDDWEVRRGKYTLDLLMRPIRDNDEIITCFRDGQVTRRSNRREDGFTFADKEIGYQGILKGDLVIHGMDGFAGAIGISDSDGKGSPVLNVCRPKNGSDTRYINYYLRTLALQNVFIALSTGIRERSCDLRWKKIAELLFTIPPLKTQQKIADYLDEKCGEIDATIAKQKESIEKLKAYKQSLISETVTKGLDKSAPLKPSGIDYLGDIPSHWEIKKLKYVANFNQNTLPEDTDGQFELKYIDIGNVSSVDGIKEIQYFNFSNAPSRARRIVKYGDIIVSTVRTYLRAITSIKEDYDNCICSTGFAVITPKDNVQQDFVVYAIENESFIAQIIANSQGISYPAINVSQLENLKLAFPSVKEQKEIVDFLKTKLLEIDSIINKKQNIIQKLDTYKKSLIFECITGKHKIY